MKKRKKKLSLTNPQRLTIIVAAVALFLSGYILYTITKNTSQKNTSKMLQNTQATPQTTLSMIKDTNHKTVYIHIDSRTQLVSGVQLALKYDPKIITSISFTPGDFFDHPMILQNAIDQQNGIMYYTLSIQTNSAQMYGEGTVAILHYNKNTMHSTKLLFLPQTKITAQGINTSLLKKATSIEIP